MPLCSDACFYGEFWIDLLSDNSDRQSPENITVCQSELFFIGLSLTVRLFWHDWVHTHNISFVQIFNLGGLTCCNVMIWWHIFAHFLQVDASVLFSSELQLDSTDSMYVMVLLLFLQHFITDPRFNCHNLQNIYMIGQLQWLKSHGFEIGP